MLLALYTLTSSLHSEARNDASAEPFIIDIEKAIGQKFIYFGDDYSTYGTHDVDLIYVRTGGTEGLFKELHLNGDIKLLTSGKSNSLAASMEILSYLRMNGRNGEIIHGSAEYIASRILNRGDQATSGCKFIKPLFPIDLGGARLGVIGKPSDWLISSDVDYKKASDKLNAEIIDIPMESLLTKLNAFDGDMRSFQGSEYIYLALKEIVKEYNLSGLTIRCFDLLDTVHNTGCLALARLNSEGIPSSCEGDVPALLSMVYLQQSKNCPGFQCNLSQVDKNRYLFAHCTVPLNMLKSFKYATHFESGIGTAIKGEIEPQKVEIFKISPDMESYVSIPAKIIDNPSLPNLCRTQIVVEAEDCSDYFLKNTLANHHIIVPEDTSRGVNPELKKYIEENIIPQYDTFDKGHQRDHVIYVIDQALRLSSFYNVNRDMIYTAAAFHDTGLIESRERHHIVSAEIIRQDDNLKQWFTQEQIDIIADAAEDHRASSDHEPRTIYGKLIAESDRQIIPETVIRRTIQFGLRHYPELDKEGHWQRTIEHLHEKYAEGGYLKLWIPESDNSKNMAVLRKIIKNEAGLREIFENIYSGEQNK